MGKSRHLVLGTTACLILVAPALLAHDPHDPISAVAVSPNFANDHTAFAGVNAWTVKFGTYPTLKTTNGGITWTVVPNLQNNNYTRQILFSPSFAADHTVFVAGRNGIFKSTDGGTTWAEMSAIAARSAVVSPNYAADQTLFMATETNQVLESTNGGQTWTTLPAPPLKSIQNVIAISPNFTADHTLLLGGGGTDGILQSTNAGTSWTLVTSGMTVHSVSSIVFSPAFATDQTVFATSMGSGFLKSTNGGVTWTAANSGITDMNATNMTLSTAYLQDSTIWLTTAAAGIFQSGNKGAGWTLDGKVNRTPSNLTTTHYLSIASAGTASAPNLFLATYEGLWTSATGTKWNYIDTAPTRIIRHINVSPNFAVDHTVFPSSYGGGNLWSTDGGRSWTFQNSGMQEAYTDCSGISPNYANDGIAFSGVSPGLQRTSDHGATWQMMQGLGITDYPRGFAISPNFAVDNTVLIGTRKPGGGPDSGLFISTDGGNIWQPTSLSGSGVISIAMSSGFATDQTAFAASPDTGLYKSTNGALKWTNITSFPKSAGTVSLVVMSPNFPVDQTVLVAPVVDGLYRSTNGGTTWTQVTGSSGVKFMDIQFSPNYANDQTFYAATMQKGILKFTEGGNTLTSLANFPDSIAFSIGISPNFATDHVMFAAGYWGLYKSVNAGNQWTNTSEPARAEEFRNQFSHFAPQNPPTFTFNGSWTFPDPELPASTYAYAITQDNTASAGFSFFGTGVRWIGWTGPDQGSATVALDGVSQGTVNLNQPTDQYQQYIFEVHGLTCAPHQLTITPVLGAGQTVSMDAMDTWVSNCPQMDAK